MNGANMAFKMPIKMNLLLNLSRSEQPVNSIPSKKLQDLPLNKWSPVLRLQENSPDTSVAVKQILHEAKSQVPFKSFGQHLSLSSFVWNEPLQWSRDGNPEIQQLFVE